MGRHDDAQVVLSAIAPQVDVDGDPEERLNSVGNLLEQTEDIVYPDDLATVVPSDLENAALTVGEFADAFQVLIAPGRLLLDIPAIPGVMGVVVFRIVIRDGQADGAGEELLHHTLLDGAGLVEAVFQRGDLGVHVGEDGGNGLLFGEGREGYLCASDVSTVGRVDLGSRREPSKMMPECRTELQVRLETIREHMLAKSGRNGMKPRYELLTLQTLDLNRPSDAFDVFRGINEYQISVVKPIKRSRAIRRQGRHSSDARIQIDIDESVDVSVVQILHGTVIDETGAGDGPVPKKPEVFP